MVDAVTDLVELRRRLKRAVDECHRFESQLQSALEHADGLSDANDPKLFESCRAKLESSLLGSPFSSLILDEESCSIKVIAKFRSIDNDARVAELQRQVEEQRQEIGRLKGLQPPFCDQDLKNSQELKSLVASSSDALAKYSDFDDKQSLVFSGASDASLSKSPRNDLNDDAQILDSLSTEQPSTEEDTFDSITIRMLKGTLTNPMFVRFLGLDKSTKKIAVFQQLSRVLRLYQKLAGISQILGRQKDIRTALTKIEDVTYDILDTELVNIYTFDKKRNIMECPGSERPSRRGFSVKIGEGCVGRLIEAPVIQRFTFDRNDYTTSKLLPCEFGAIKVRSMMISPIMDDESQKLLGVVQCFNKKRGVFSQSDEEILKQITRQAAVILITKLKFQEDIRKQERNEAIMDIVKTVNSNEDVDEIIAKVVEASYRVVRCDRVSVFMIDPSTNELWFKISKDAQATGFRFPVGKGIAGFVAASGQSLNIIDAYQDERFSAALDKQSNYLTRTVLCVPVCNFRGKPVAVIQCINKHCSLCNLVPCPEHQIQFEDSDLEIMQTFAREIASALQRKAQESSFQQAMDMNGNKSHMKDYISQFIGGQSKSLNETRSDAIEWPLMSSQAAQSSLCDWNFEIFDHTLDELLGLSENIYDILELTESFKIQRGTLRNFLFEIRSMYYDNPYHNFRHAFSVMHMCFLFITTTSAKTMLTGADIFVLVTAALGHDLCHPGLNNDFLIHSEDELSIRYNDVSVLENHHAATLCQLFRKNETDILSNLSKQERQVLRKSMVDAILHTDMSQHKSMLEALIYRANSSMKLSRNNPADRQLMVNNILHCSDIGNPVLPIHMSVKWAELIQQEFYLQAKREKDLSLPYASFMLNTSQEALANLQINFITYVVRPIWKAMNDFLPEIAFAMENMDANRINWEAIAKEHQDNKQP